MELRRHHSLAEYVLPIVSYSRVGSAPCPSLSVSPTRDVSPSVCRPGTVYASRASSLDPVEEYSIAPSVSKHKHNEIFISYIIIYSFQCLEVLATKQD